MNDLDSWLMRGARADLSGAADAVVLAAAIAVAVSAARTGGSDGDDRAARRAGGEIEAADHVDPAPCVCLRAGVANGYR